MSKITHINQLFDREEDIKTMRDNWYEENKDWVDAKFEAYWYEKHYGQHEVGYAPDYMEVMEEFIDDEFFKVRSRWI